jgi:hypothetical protein
MVSILCYNIIKSLKITSQGISYALKLLFNDEVLLAVTAVCNFIHILSILITCKFATNDSLDTLLFALEIENCSVHTHRLNNVPPCLQNTFAVSL